MAKQTALYPKEAPLALKTSQHSLLIGLPKEVSLQENRIALTPEDMPLADALAAVDAALADDLRLLVFSFHSPSLAPGHTPYVRDAADLRGFWRWWDAVLDRLDRRGVRPASLTEILAAAGTP